MSVTKQEGRTVSIRTAIKLINTAFKSKRPVMLWGAPGIGKSDLVEKIANDLGRDLIDVRLPLWEPTDIKGMPFMNTNTGTMEWAPPAEFPTDPDSNAIIFLDEINGAAPSVQAAAYQLILNRRVGQYKLPKNVLIIAAGNRDSDKGVTYRMPKPLANRFVHLDLRVDFDCWLDWAIENKIHADVVGFLQFSKRDLYDFDPKADNKAFATPRSWSFVSELLEEESELTSVEETDLISGCVGEGIAIKFNAHRELRGKLPNPGDILDGKVKKLESNEISVQYAITTGMCYELKEGLDNAKKENDMDTWHEQTSNFIQFMMDNFNTEMVIYGARLALKNYQLPFNHKKIENFKDFFERYGKLVIEA